MSDLDQYPIIIWMAWIEQRYNFIGSVKFVVNTGLTGLGRIGIRNTLKIILFTSYAVRFKTTEFTWLRFCVFAQTFHDLQTVNRSWGIDDFARMPPFHKETVFGFHIVGTFNQSNPLTYTGTLDWYWYYFTLFGTLFSVSGLQWWLQSKWKSN